MLHAPLAWRRLPMPLAGCMRGIRGLRRMRGNVLLDLLPALRRGAREALQQSRRAVAHTRKLVGQLRAIQPVLGGAFDRSGDPAKLFSQRHDLRTDFARAYLRILVSSLHDAIPSKLGRSKNAAKEASSDHLYARLTSTAVGRVFRSGEARSAPD